VPALIAIWVALIALTFYFLLWRPQQRRMSAVRTLQEALREGDEVMTTSGIYGRITKLGEADAQLEIAPNTVIHVARGAIGERLTVDGAAADSEDAGGRDETIED
jgi:preprotein translocase subunit YajC